MTLSVYYRGSLSSCNYDCAYCPFAKQRDRREALARDAAALARFVGWVRGAEWQLRILFTPWGEALIHRPYREALVTLSRFPHVRRVAIQTNLTGPLEELAGADREALSLWCTFHPSQTSLEAFVARCRRLDALGLRYCVGAVGLREDLTAIEALRERLPPEVYLWVNAYKRPPFTYRDDERRRLEAVDPLFPLNARRHPSRGLPCDAGHRSISVDAEGTVRRCHFVGEPLGHLDEGFTLSQEPQPCPQSTCGCYIGYAQLRPLGLRAVYGDGLLERRPEAPPRARAAHASLAALDAARARLLAPD